MAKGLIALLLALAAGCAREGPSDTRFVHFYADVVHAQRAALDSADAADSALAVAARHRMTERELMMLRERLVQDPERWVAIWDRVLARLHDVESASDEAGDVASPQVDPTS